MEPALHVYVDVYVKKTYADRDARFAGTPPSQVRERESVLYILVYCMEPASLVQPEHLRGLQDETRPYLNRASSTDCEGVAGALRVSVCVPHVCAGVSF